jgi:hypothetical protein
MQSFGGWFSVHVDHPYGDVLLCVASCCCMLHSLCAVLCHAVLCVDVAAAHLLQGPTLTQGGSQAVDTGGRGTTVGWGGGGKEGVWKGGKVAEWGRLKGGKGGWAFEPMHTPQPSPHTPETLA